MIQTLDFNSFAAGTVIDNEYRALGVTVSASGGANQAMIFDSANPTGGDDDLASDRLGGVLIISEDGDGADPDDNASGGSLFFDFALPALIKSLTLKDIENGGDARMIFYAEDGSVIDNQWVGGTGDEEEPSPSVCHLRAPSGTPGIVGQMKTTSMLTTLSSVGGCSIPLCATQSCASWGRIW